MDDDRSRTTDNESSGRVGGKFAAGNQLGRKPGTPNRSTTDARELRSVILGDFEPGEWWEWARKNDRNRTAWLRFLGSIWPKEIDACIEQLGPKLDARELKPDDVRNYFHRQLIAIANGDPITSETVLRQLEMNRAGRNGHDPKRATDDHAANGGNSESAVF